MDREKYPNYFLTVVVLYAIMFLIAVANFILPSLGCTSLRPNQPSADFVKSHTLIAISGRDKIWSNQIFEN